MKKIMILIAVSAFVVCADISFAQNSKETKPSAVKTATDVSSKKVYTKEEMVAGIKKVLTAEEGVANLIPGIKKSVAKNGEALFTYEGAGLEELDSEKLRKIFNRVRAEATRIRTDRMNSQIENIRRNQQLMATAGRAVSITPSVPVSQPAPAPATPNTQQVPKVPPQLPTTTRR